MIRPLLILSDRFVAAALMSVMIGWCGSVASQAADQKWPPPGGVPITRWGKTVSPDKPVLPEYPRPQMQRDAWMNLNGLWDFAVADVKAEQPEKYPQKILVPYPPQSVLSQVNQWIDQTQRVWYRRTFEIPQAWSGKRVLLHFGAVSWAADVWVNDVEVKRHEGSYDGFTVDITQMLHAGGPQKLVVSAWNPVEQGGVVRGKQSLRPGGIFYTPTTGIWQTVWLEPVSNAYIDHLRIVPDVDHHQVHVTAATPNAGPDATVELTVSASGRTIAKASGSAGKMIDVTIPKPRLWWPEDPFLYDLKVTLHDGGAATDSVSSYFGMRKISIGLDKTGRQRMLLNNQFVFENGFLDQGFWPDGVYTAPTDAARKFDIEMARKFGYNMVRKHIKVEPDRWYYWADKLGLLVWQDMPACTEMGFGPHKNYQPDIEGRFECELRRMIRGRFNHPCIVTWVVFNEGWGLSLKPKKPGEIKDIPTEDAIALVHRMSRVTRAEDPTRLIDAESGAGGGKGPAHDEPLWDFGDGDIIDYHNYSEMIPEATAKRAAVIGEYGWGLNPRAVFMRLIPGIQQHDVSAMVLTQLTDVENERNGPLTYDRQLKEKVTPEQIGEEVIRHMHEAGFTNYPGHDAGGE